MANVTRNELEKESVQSPSWIARSKSLSGFPRKTPSSPSQGPDGDPPAADFPEKVGQEARLYVFDRRGRAVFPGPLKSFEPSGIKCPFLALFRLSSEITLRTTADEGKGRLNPNQSEATAFFLAHLLRPDLAQGPTWVKRSNVFCPFAEKTPFMPSRVSLDLPQTRIDTA